MSAFFLTIEAGNETPTINNSIIRTYFERSIELDHKKKYEMALVSFNTYRSYTNINDKNNVFRYSPNNGTSNFTIYVQEGAYEVNELNTYIQAEMKRQVGNLYREDGVVIGANLMTLKATLKFGKSGPTTHYYVDFNVTNSLATVLGFNKEEYTYVERREDPINPDRVTSFTNYYESEHQVRIDEVTSIRITSDIIGDSYSNGKSVNDIYAFLPNVSPGFKIIKKPIHLFYYPIVVNKISRIETRIIDQKGNLIDFRGEDIIIRFHVREKSNYIP